MNGAKMLVLAVAAGLALSGCLGFGHGYGRHGWDGGVHHGGRYGEGRRAGEEARPPRPCSEEELKDPARDYRCTR